MEVEQANSYAEETMGANAYASWKAITCEDSRAFMGFNILMGINRQPSTEDYWKKDPIHYYKPIAQRISRDRFWDISRYLHFVDNSTLSLRGSANYDKLGKVRPLIKHFQERFSSLYNPNSEIAIDEAMIAEMVIKKDVVKHQLGARVVKDLTKELQGKWHHVYFDNLFTSYSLLSDLEKSGIYGCGTARKDRRGFPEKLKTAKFKNR